MDLYLRQRVLQVRSQVPVHEDLVARCDLERGDLWFFCVVVEDLYTDRSVHQLLLPLNGGALVDADAPGEVDLDTIWWRKQ